MQLTIMVRLRNVSAYRGVTPSEGQGLKIGNTPLYSLEAIKEIAKKPNAVFLWTEKSQQHVADMNLDTDGVANLIQTIKDSEYRDSEWCENGKGCIAGCDSYGFIRREYCEAAQKMLDFDYYFKLGINKTNSVILIASCHPS